jgi:hypothetical protein
MTETSYKKIQQKIEYAEEIGLSDVDCWRICIQFINDFLEEFDAIMEELMK